MSSIVTVAVSSSLRTKQQSFKMSTLRCGGLSRRPPTHSAHHEQDWQMGRFTNGALSSDRITRVSNHFRCARLFFRLSLILRQVSGRFWTLCSKISSCSCVPLDVNCSSGLTGHKTQVDASLTSPALENLRRSLQPTFARRRFLLFSRALSSVQS